MRSLSDIIDFNGFIDITQAREAIILFYNMKLISAI